MRSLPEVYSVVVRLSKGKYYWRGLHELRSVEGEGMMETDLAGQLEGLFHEVGEAPHQAYIETDGADPEWPLWYADYLRERLVRSLRPASPRASSSTCSSWSPTSSRFEPQAPTGPDTTP